MSNEHHATQIIIQSNRIILDAHTLALATLLITAAAGAISCGGQTSTPVPSPSSGGASTGGSPVIGPGVCAVYASGGITGSSTVTDSGFVAGVCPISASGGAPNSSADASVGTSTGGNFIGGGIC